MNNLQIEECAAECSEKISRSPGLARVEYAEMIAEVMLRHIAEAKEAEDDVKWLQGLVAGAVKANLPGCHAETHRMIRILRRLENEVRK